MFCNYPYLFKVPDRAFIKDIPPRISITCRYDMPLWIYFFHIPGHFFNPFGRRVIFIPEFKCQNVRRVPPPRNNILKFLHVIFFCLFGLKKIFRPFAWPTIFFIVWIPFPVILSPRTFFRHKTAISIYAQEKINIICPRRV